MIISIICNTNGECFNIGVKLDFGHKNISFRNTSIHKGFFASWEAGCFAVMRNKL
jgi:hypothetical protein